MYRLKEYSIAEYKQIKGSLIGSLVCFYWDHDEGIIEKRGTGIVIDARREKGRIFVKVAWAKSPFISFKEERKVGWHSYDRLFILQYPNGVNKHVDKNKNSERTRTKGSY